MHLHALVYKKNIKTGKFQPNLYYVLGFIVQYYWCYKFSLPLKNISVKQNSLKCSLINQNCTLIEYI